MLCRRCAELILGTTKRSRSPARRPRNAAASVGVLCVGCGALLLPEEAAGRWLDKLTQLAQFGLIPGGEPLLRSAEPGGVALEES